MLGKLLKYEIKATSRTFIPLYIALILVALINNLFMAGDIRFGFGITMMILVGLFIALGVLTLVVLIQRFNKNLLGDEGYLMFTLPVKPYQLILSKLIVTVFWTIISGIISIITFVLLVGGFNLTFLKDFLKEFFTHRDIILSTVNTVMQNEIFRQGLMMIITFCVIGLLSYIGSILEIYLSLSIGQLPIFSKHRGISAFVAFFVINSVLQVIIALLSGFGATFYSHFGTPSVGMMCTVGIIGTLLVDCILFFIVNYILNKHLNLE